MTNREQRRTPLRLLAMLVAWVVSLLAVPLLVAPSTAAADITACAGAGASFAGGSGTTVDPYQVATQQQLSSIRGNYVSCAFRQVSDITMTSDLAPIGSYAAPFTGSYDGGGHSITQLTVDVRWVDAPDQLVAGMFGATAGATIANLTVSGWVDVPLTAGTGTPKPMGGVGGLIGMMDPRGSVPTMVSDVVVNVAVMVTADLPAQGSLGAIGGVVGSMASLSPPSGANLTRVTSTGKVTANVSCPMGCSVNDVGGAIGVAGALGAGTAMLQDVMATGDVDVQLACAQDNAPGTPTCAVTDTGGLAGEMNLNSTWVPASVLRARASGDVTVACTQRCDFAMNTGGLVGSARFVNFSRVGATGDVAAMCDKRTNGCSGVAGLIPYTWRATMERAYSSGHASGQTGVGGLVDTAYMNPQVAPQVDTITDSYSRTAVTASLAPGGSAAGLMVDGDIAVVGDVYSTGVVSGTSAAGLLGNITQGAVTDSVWDTQTSGQAASPGGGTGQSTAAMRAISTYQAMGWSIANGWPTTDATTWGICFGQNGGYPFLQWQYASPPNCLVAPVDVEASAGDARATVTWDPPPTTGGSAISSYTVTALPGGATCAPALPATTCTVTGLTNTTSYTFTVTATNGLGTSPASAASNAVTPQSNIPGAPTDVNGTSPAEPGRIVATWTAPAYTGGAGSVITNYTVTASPGGATCTTGSGATTTCTIVSGLTNGTQYTLTATATNNAPATSAASAPSAPVIPTGGWSVPAAPSAVVATPGDTQASVTWTAPAAGSTGGAPITGYTVTASPGGATCATSGPTTCTVSGLANGTAYTFTVVATDVVGGGPASAASAPVVPKAPTPPGPPTAADATAGDGQVTVDWDAPASTGGSAITGYVVTATPGGATCSTAGATSCSVTGLANLTAYTFVVAATNAIGTGVASAPTTPVTPQPGVTVPGPPTAVAAIGGNARATVTWTPPVATGGLPVTTYTATASPGGLTCTAGAPANSCVITGLTNGTWYSMTVVARNAVGPSAPSAPSATIAPHPSATASSAPTAVTTSVGDGRVAIAWGVPADTGGLPITAYAVTTVGSDAACDTDAGGTSCTVGGLSNGTRYTFKVMAQTAVGFGAAAVTAGVVPVPGSSVPGAPGTPRATPGSSRATVTFSAPPADGGSPITGYSVVAAPGGATCTAVSPAAGCTVRGLRNGTSYTFTASARNANGLGPASPPATPVTPQPAPVMLAHPARRVVTGGVTRITLTVKAGRTGTLGIAVTSRGRRQPLLPGSAIGTDAVDTTTSRPVSLAVVAGRRYALTLLLSRRAPRSLTLSVAYSGRLPRTTQSLTLPTGASRSPSAGH